MPRRISNFGRIAVLALQGALLCLPIPSLAAGGWEGTWIAKQRNTSLSGLPILGDFFQALGAVDAEAVWLITRDGDGYIVRIPHRDFSLAVMPEGQRLYGEYQTPDDDPDDDEVPGKNIVDVTLDGDGFTGMLTLDNGVQFPVVATRFEIGDQMHEKLAAVAERLAVSERRVADLQAEIDVRPDLPPGMNAETFTALQAQVVDLRNQNLRLQGELDNPPINQATAEAQAKLVAEAAVLQAEIDRINLVNQQLGVEVAQLQSELNAARAMENAEPDAAAGLETELLLLRQEIGAANALVVSLNVENQSLLTEAELAAERAVQLELDLFQAQAQTAQAEEKRSSARLTLDLAEAQIEDRAGEVVRLQAANAAVNEERENQQARILTLEAEITTANAENKIKVGEVGILQAANAAANEERENQQARILFLEAEIKTGTAEREKQVGQVLTLQAEIATVNAENVQWFRELDSLRAEAAPLADLNAGLIAEVDVLRRDLGEVNGLKLQVQAEKNRAQGDLVQARSELDAANQEAALLTEENLRIQLELFAHSQETEAMALDINRLNARTAELAAENDFLQSRNLPISFEFLTQNLAAQTVTIRQAPSPDAEIFGTVQSGEPLWVLGNYPGFLWALVATENPRVIGFGLIDEIYRLAQ